jgi:hypothetical protein
LSEDTTGWRVNARLLLARALNVVAVPCEQGRAMPVKAWCTRNDSRLHEVCGAAGMCKGLTVPMKTKRVVATHSAIPAFKDTAHLGRRRMATRLRIAML